MDPTTQAAINAALSRDWKTAIELNLRLLKDNSKDIDSLNRLGRAYFETGQKAKAEEVYHKVLKMDKFNSIATKNLELLKTSRVTHDGRAKFTTNVPPPIFLEEPGVTKTVTLTRPGDPKVTSRLHPGDPVSIVPHDHCVSVMSQSNEYLGRLPDDLASRLLPFLHASNKYYVWIKSVDGLKIFIKEVSRAAKYKNTPSFPMTEKLSYAAFVPPEWVHDERPNTSVTEEQEEVNSSERDVDPDTSAPVDEES